MKRKIIFFDIDDTLIDSSNKLGPLFCLNISEQTKVSIEKIIEIKSKYRLTLEKGSDYVPNDLINTVCNELKIDIGKINNPFDIEDIYKNAVFSKVVEALEKLSKKYTLGIFSEGFEDYKSKKIILSGLIKYFDKKWIFIERRKLSPEALIKIPIGSIIIDDKKEVIETLKNLRPDLELIWINRKDKEKIEGVKTIKSLEEMYY